MENVLYLTHRIPYPPNKGDKIRSYHLLRHLAERYNVFLGTFIDDAHDRRYVAKVQQFCRCSYFAALHPQLARWRSLGALLHGRPLSLDYYASSALAGWVARQMRRRAIGRVVIYSSVMAQFVEAHRGARVVVDFCDVDSEKWRAYADGKPRAIRWLYRREARALLAYERAVAARAAAALFVSDSEAELFRCLAPASAGRVAACENGVDASYFSPERVYANPFAAGERTIVFCGAMDYWPNVQAVRWFAQQVLPALAARFSFWIVGARPAPAVRALERSAGVRVTGTVDDVRPYLAHCAAVVAPLAIARGIQNKVLEAMAMARPIVASPQALEGIAATPGQHLLLAQTPDEFRDRLLEVAAGAPPALGAAARALVTARYSWAARFDLVSALLEAHDELR